MNRIIVFRAFVILPLLLFALTLVEAQDVHSPTFYGMFFDSKDGLIELNEPQELQPIILSDSFLVREQQFHPKQVAQYSSSSLIFYGDKYTTSSVKLFKFIANIGMPQSEEEKAHKDPEKGLLFKEIKLRSGPCIGVQGACTKLMTEKPIEDNDYILAYEHQFYPLSVTIDKSLNPIKDELNDVAMLGDGKIVATSKGGIYVYDGSWTYIPQRRHYPSRIIPSLSNKAGFYVLDAKDGRSVLYFIDGANSADISVPTSISQGGLFSGNTWPTTINDLAEDPQRPGHLIAVGTGSSGGLFTSHNKGIVLSSLDYGKKWDFVADEASNIANEDQDLGYVNCIIFSNEDSKSLFIGTSGEYASTTDGGKKWASSSRISNITMIKVKLDGSKSAAYVKDNRELLLFDGPSKGIVQSTGLPKGIITSIVWDTKSLIVSIQKAGIFESIDNGSTWSPLNNGLKSRDVRTVILGTTDQILYAATDVGLFKSTDRGKTWSEE